MFLVVDMSFCLSGLLCREIGTGNTWLLGATWPQVALHCSDEDLVIQGQQLAIVPEDTMPAPKDPLPGTACMQIVLVDPDPSARLTTSHRLTS